MYANMQVRYTGKKGLSQNILPRTNQCVSISTLFQRKPNVNLNEYKKCSDLRVVNISNIYLIPIDILIH